MLKFSVIVTSYKEPQTIGKAIEQIVNPNKNLWNEMQLIVVAGDDETLEVAKLRLLQLSGFKNYILIKDNAKGKPQALNMAVAKAATPVLILTDGDMYIDDNAISLLLEQIMKKRVAGVSGHPISLDDRKTFWGFSSHLYCYGAHKARSEKNSQTPMSGYLYAIKNLNGIFPLPKNVRAEDAYISNKIIELGFKIEYSPNSYAYVYFPKTLKDWINQKKRSLGGNKQLNSTRNIFQDLQKALLPLQFAKSPKEYLFVVAIYPLRLCLWIIIYLQHTKKSYSVGRWERIESSKFRGYPGSGVAPSSG